MCSPQTFQPYRAKLPVRTCKDCGCILASDHDDDSCSPCDPGPKVITIWSAVERRSIGDALAELMEAGL